MLRMQNYLYMRKAAVVHCTSLSKQSSSCQIVTVIPTKILSANIHFQILAAALCVVQRSTHSIHVAKHQSGCAADASACRGVWMGMLLLWCAASIILPIIKAEGIIAVFFPYLVRQPQVTPHPPADLTDMSLCVM